MHKYLHKYAEDIDLGWSGMVGSTGPSFDVGVVIPSYAEGAEVVGAVAHAVAIGAETGRGVLVVLVVNEPPGASAVVRQSNRETVSELARRYGTPTWDDGHSRYWEVTGVGGVLCVERTHRTVPIPKEEGVGRARKIGMDVLVGLWASKRLKTPWLWTTDADAILPDDYFVWGYDRPGVVALVYPFLHIPSDNEIVNRGTQAHEARLRYYVDGVRRAGSPYAFHTVGSTMAIHVNAYCAVRGVPCRSAGEDFYLLNKVAKVGRVETLDGEAIVLQSRWSDRAPFGTGAAVGKTTQDGQDPWEQPTYAPGCFDALRTGLQWAETALQQGDPSVPMVGLASDAQELVRQHMTPAMERALEERPDRRLKRFHEGFDGFRTLKLIHALRDKVFGTLPLNAVISD